MLADPQTFDRMKVATKHTPGPWEYVPSTKHHGPYVTGPYGGDICDCYTMSNPGMPSVRNGGDSRPIPFMQERADPNARLIAAAPEMLAQLIAVRGIIAEGAMTGFNQLDGDWAERLFKSQGQTTDAINKATRG